MSSGHVARIYNPHPDPLERGPPKRVNRDEAHVGERIAASKKRISWTFTLGDCETIHEVVLTHSIMTYKKLVEFDRRQMHLSSTAHPGDWCFMMVLDGTNNVIEVRINDTETDEVPKYDLVIDRIPFRKWDVFRRRKAPAGSTSYGAPVPNAAPTATFGTHRWGPAGDESASRATDPPAELHAQQRAGSFSSSRNNWQQSASGYAPPPTAVSNHGVPSRNPNPETQPARRVSAKQPEINLIDDSIPEVAVPAQNLMFDPLLQMSAPPAPQQATQPSPVAPPSQPVATQPSQPSNVVDPFAGLTSALPTQPSQNMMNLDPLARHNSAYLKGATQASPSQIAQVGPSSVPAQPLFGQAGQMNMTQRSGAPGQAPRASFTFDQTGAKSNVNYNISHLMNPNEVNNVRKPQGTNAINIDAFASLNPR